MRKIFVTKPSLPSFLTYSFHLLKIWKSKILTNNGEYFKKFNTVIETYIGTNTAIVSNGTEAINLIIKALNINNSEIITTPYSFVATTNAILLTNNKPIFVDINRHDLIINSSLIESKITKNTKAVLITQVYGLNTDLTKISDICEKYHLPLIIDGAHSFGTKDTNGNQILLKGFVSTTSFHATKVLSCGEGGAIFSKNKDLIKKIRLLSNFGIIDENEINFAGTNAKLSEFHSLLGLLNFKSFNANIKGRLKVANLYHKHLNKKSIRLIAPYNDLKYNYSYFPIHFTEKKGEETRDIVYNKLKEKNIYCRKYFNTSLNKLVYVDNTECPVSEYYAKTILCLPIYKGLSKKETLNICKEINTILNQLYN